MYHLRAALLLSASLLAVGLPAKAQVAATPSANGQPAAAPPASAGQLQEVVVTAQRRSERLQDVPIAVTAVSGQEVTQLGVRDTRELTALVPALQIAQSNNSALPFLRGIGSSSGIIGNESSVSMYVDGVYRPSLTAGVFGLASVDRIEVLKGPQGTLFGRNATGGVVQVVTKEPNQTPSLDLAAGYGNFSTVDVNMLANTPLTDRLAMNVAVYSHDQQDGWGRDLATGGSALRSNEWSVRPRFVWRGDTTKISLNYSYDHMWSDIGSLGVPLGSTVLINGATNAGFFNVFNGSPQQYSRRDSHVVDAHVEQELGPVSLVSITSYQTDDSYLTVSEDMSPLNFLTGSINQRERTWTQELQLLSNPGSPIRWIAGAFYFNSQAQYAPARLAGPALATPPPLGPGLPYEQINSSQTTQSWAGFGQATATVLPDTDLTLGLRYTVDQHDFTGLVATQPGVLPFAPSGVLSNTSASTNVSKPTWRVSLDHKFAPDMMAYVSYNRGFKSGQFNLSSPTDPPVRPETLDAYEIGFKSQFWDRRLRVNASAFYYDYRDIQVQLIQSGLPILVNAASATVKGFDLDMAGQLTPELRVHGALAYTDGRYSQFKNAPYYSSNAPFPGDSVQPNGNASGNRMIQAPVFTGNFGGSYRMASPDGPVELAANYSYNSGYELTIDNKINQPAFHLVSASLTWKPDGVPFAFTLWGENLLDQRYLYQAIQAATGNFGIPAAPRTYGIRTSVKF